MIGAVLLDLGGVLVDLGPSSALPHGRLDWRGRQALLGALGRSRRSWRLEDLEDELFAPWRSEHERRMEHGREARWEPHVARLGTDLAAEELLAIWCEPYLESLAPLPGAVDAVRALAAAGRRLALVSNVPLPGDLYRRALAESALFEPFDELCFSYDRGSRKPSPKMVTAALAALNAAPHEAVMVGDRRATDVAAGRAAGTRTVWVRRNKAPGPAADAEIDDVTALPELLAGWT